jgi:hypothetical protein
MTPPDIIPVPAAASVNAAPVNPFEGQGGCFYLNPNGSNELKRDRNELTPFHALTDEQKAARINAVPADLMGVKERGDAFARLTLPPVAPPVTALLGAASTAPAPAKPNTSKGGK